jgi:hypothetical protein
MAVDYLLPTLHSTLNHQHLCTAHGRRLALFFKPFADDLKAKPDLALITKIPF